MRRTDTGSEGEGRGGQERERERGKEGERAVNHASGFKSDTVKSFCSDP